MGSSKNPQNQTEKREYLRLKTIFPVDFTIVRLQGDLPGVDWLRGYTANVAKGGICLETSDVGESLVDYLKKENIYLDLRIHVPLGTKPLKAVGEIAWKEKVSVDGVDKFILGIKFHSIIKSDLEIMLKFAQGLTWISQGVIAFSCLIFVGLLIYLIIENFQILFP